MDEAEDEAVLVNDVAAARTAHILMDHRPSHTNPYKDAIVEELENGKIKNKSCMTAASETRFGLVVVAAFCCYRQIRFQSLTSHTFPCAWPMVQSFLSLRPVTST